MRLQHRGLRRSKTGLCPDCWAPPHSRGNPGKRSGRSVSEGSEGDAFDPFPPKAPGSASFIPSRGDLRVGCPPNIPVSTCTPAGRGLQDVQGRIRSYLLMVTNPVSYRISVHCRHDPSGAQVGGWVQSRRAASPNTG